ncbi:TonB-dependent receptor domain-containing protein [Niabella drilacis]|uniref:Outer membrane receptor proteins, mostly Fe transport n=1 Tax=Niabella drilacis (strain DSM 25811 / CCM 8410 / CCUG 62505 / LMG 26954 / E90) TaxID=1285928 RepID=A0A1G6W4X6_NIADE|nr:TonB-dependent receptor [Niabella drilacis]SDD60874.1 Outer membrane receptor proteins, mostly Fe transport [Niabella drilacis]
MKKQLFLGLMLLLSTCIYAQNGQMPAGALYGRVVDSATGKGIDAASIQLVQIKKDSASGQNKTTVVTGMLTKANGEFRLEGVPAIGRYQLEITGIGYKAYQKPFSFIDPAKLKQGNRDMASLLGNLDKDLGNIRLGIDNQTLSNVTVSGSKPSVSLGIDRKVYNVENNLMAAGGTATDLLKNIPSVNVDIDGNISIRNSSPQIFVDGRPTTLTLDQIPSDQIETIEVITNPSAKYDASGGTAGILNIVLKKTKRVGYSGNVRAGIDQRGKLNAGGNVNVRQGKFNIFANANYGQRKSVSDGTTERSTTLSDTTTRLLQTDHNVGDGTFMFGRAGFDYFLDNRNTLTLSGIGVKGKFNNNTESDLFVDTLANGYQAHSKTIRESNGNFSFRNLGGSLGYVHNFPKNGHQLTADANYNKSKNDNQTAVNNSIFDNVSGPQTRSFNQLQKGNGTTERITAQADYTNPLSDNSKLEAGVRMNQTSVSSQNNMYYVLSNGALQLQPPLSSRFDYKDQVLAAYGNFSSKIGEKFGYQVGVRLESSNYDGTVYTSTRNSSGNFESSSNHFNIKYPVSLFPSVFLSQKLNDKQDLQLNYSRRINRPGFFQLFPFTDYSDSLNLSRGNPDLKPEFTNSFELSYSNNFNRNNSLILSVYYKHTFGLITRYQSPDVNPINDRPVLVNTFINANSSFVGGFEAVGKNKLTPWWDLTSNVNIYTSKINIDDPAIPTADQIYSWFGKINNDFKLPANFTLQLSGDYNSKTVLAPGGSSSNNSGGGRGFMGGTVSGNAQGYTMPNYGVDAALKYEFLKGKAASVTLSVNDIFKTRKNDVYTSSTFFNQHQVRTRDQQFFRLNFAYRFGKFDASLFKRKNMKGEQESIQGGMQGMGGQ